MKLRRRLRCERNNLTVGSLNSWAADFKGPLLLGLQKKWILCCVEVNIRFVHFSIANSLEAKEVARLLFEGIIASYGSAIEIMSDRGSSFLSKINTELFTLGSTHHRLTMTAHPQSEVAEGWAIRKFSSAMKALICGKTLSEWASNVRFLQVLLNSSLIHPHLNRTPYAVLMNSESTFYHPLLDKPEEKIPFGSFWEKRIKKFQDMNKVLKEKYDVMLCQKGSPRHTVDSLGIEPGMTVWIRIFKFAPRLAYLSSLLPKFKPAKVITILGKTSLLLEDLESGRKVCRHLTDVYPMKAVGNFSNLFRDGLSAQQQEAEEDFSNTPVNKVPEMCLDGTGVDRLKQEEVRQKVDHRKSGSTVSGESKQARVWDKRLRQRKQVNYKS